VAVAPDSRYYVHASTHAAHAQQEYLVQEAGGSKLPASTSTKGPWFNLRTDWWIVIALIALMAFVAGLMNFVR